MWPILNCHYLQQRQLAKEQEIDTNHFVTLHMITVRNGKQSFWTGGSIPEAVFFGRNIFAPPPQSFSPFLVEIASTD